MPAGRQRSAEFNDALTRLWNLERATSEIVSELTAKGWPVNRKIVMNYAAKLGLPRRGPPQTHYATNHNRALSDAECKVFFDGLDRLW